jgi:hypothetical protein
LVEGVSCPSVGLCVAVDQVGDVVTSNNPAGGAAAWTVTHVDNTKDPISEATNLGGRVLSDHRAVHRGGHQRQRGHVQQPHRWGGGLGAD